MGSIRHKKQTYIYITIREKPSKQNTTTTDIIIPHSYCNLLHSISRPPLPPSKPYQMGQKQQSTVSESESESMAEPKKRRRVAFAAPDDGCEANQCIDIFLVSSAEEAEAGTGFRIKPIDLNQFFEADDGKIYGYQGLKITVWVSSISFHAYANVTYDSISDGGKGITDLKSSLQNMFGENLIEKKDDFLQTFTSERQYIGSITSTGEKIMQYASTKDTVDSLFHSDAKPLVKEVTRLKVGDLQVGHLYSRLVPLVLLLVDGSNPIDVTDAQWELYLLVQKTIYQHQESQVRLLGFAAVYRFYHYPDSSRLRLSQILVLPPYQGKGYGKCLLEVIADVAVSEDVYDLTIEEPLDTLQRIRNTIDIPRLLACSPVKHAVDEAVLYLKEANLSKRTHASQIRPPMSIVEEVRKILKINGKQFIHCWEILIYLAIERDDKYLQNYKTFITDNIKATILGKDSGTTGKLLINVPSDYDEDMSFIMYKSQSDEGVSISIDGNQANQEQQLQQLVEERIEEIKLVSQKLSECNS